MKYVLGTLVWIYYDTYQDRRVGKDGLIGDFLVFQPNRVTRIGLLGFPGMLHPDLVYIK